MGLETAVYNLSPSTYLHGSNNTTEVHSVAVTVN